MLSVSLLVDEQVYIEKMETGRHDVSNRTFQHFGFLLLPKNNDTERRDGDRGTARMVEARHQKKSSQSNLTFCNPPLFHTLHFTSVHTLVRL